jgi:acetyl esterase/lipase
MNQRSHRYGGQGKGQMSMAAMRERHHHTGRCKAILHYMSDHPRDRSGKLLAMPEAPDAIELRHLRAFVAVADELNFGRAAARLYLSQPALSRQIRTLERLVGCDLLRRSTHRVELTLAGEALLGRARQVLQELDDAVSATRSVGGELAARMTQLWEPVGDTGTDLERVRTAYEALHAQFSPPPEVTIRSVNTGGVASLLVTDQPEAGTTVLYLHGGGYVAGSAFGYRHLAAALATAAETGVLLPEYRLAPEHPFPAAIEDALSAYLWIMDSGVNPQRVTLAGDSAGAHLALSLLITIRQQQLPLPGRAVLLSPWADLANIRDQTHGEPQPVATPEQQRRWMNSYLAGHPGDDAVISPLTADLTGFPPMLIQAGTGDPLVEDAHRLADHARGHNVDVQLQLYPVPTHDFHIFWSFLPEAADALHQAGRFIRDTTPGKTPMPHAPDSGTSG